ncbi:MAG TPA: SGNH/GDSL hydrolase family protein [Pyrinomonadaceae bacterium]|nr:SGNH/GDSL hydrolase family protein [Pyrinomonadaceae bacterium]
MANVKRWAAKLLLVCLSIIFALLAAEIGLRLVGYSYPYFYAFEEQTGWMHRAGVSGWFRKEGEAYITINSAGMRDLERARAKPPHVYRVAVLGDSFAEALQVPLEQTFWHLLEDRLASCRELGGGRVEVLNFGVSSYGTAQELMALRGRVWDYDPDMIVLTFTPGNDVRNNSRALEQDELRPYFVIRGDQLVADTSFRQSPVFRRKLGRLNSTLYDAINYSRVLQAVNAARDGYLTRRKYEQMAGGAQAAGGEGGAGAVGGGVGGGGVGVGDAEPGLDELAFRPPPDERWAEAWRVTEGIITQMGREVRERGVGFLVAVVSDGPQVSPDASARQALARRLGVPDLFYPGRRLEQLGAREGFPVLDLGPPFQAYAEQQRRPLHGFDPQRSAGHWNAEGHRLASELIAASVCEAQRRGGAGREVAAAPRRAGRRRL